MRFRLSTLLLTLTLACVLLGWAFTEWRRRVSHANEFVVASEFARFKAYNDIYSSIDGIALTPQQDRDRRRLLQNTVKSTPYLIELDIPDRHEILSYEYRFALRRIAYNALLLLEIGSPEEFEKAIIGDGELDLLEWDLRNPDIQLQVQVLDADTKKLKPKFREYLKSVIEFGRTADD